MNFLNDLWKKFKMNEGDFQEEIAVLPSEPIEKNHQQENIQKKFQAILAESVEKESLYENLKALKELMSEPKEEKLDIRSDSINEHLGEPECYETLRQDRWNSKIKCPDCQSKKIKRISQTKDKSLHNYRYKCLECGREFNDDSDTGLEKMIPPINIWMQCWYLMGCTDSLSYIASKLNLDISTIEFMARELRKIFNVQKPLTNLLKFEEWSKQSENLRKQLKDDLLRQYEFLDANISTTPKDTTEYRRQQTLRRTLNSTFNPTSPTVGPKKR